MEIEKIKCNLFFQDGLVFGWTYLQFGSNFVDDEKWAEYRFIQYCGYSSWMENVLMMEMYGIKVKPWWTFRKHWNYISPSFSFTLGYLAALWSRLAEIGVRITFIVFASTASLLFDKLDNKIEEMAKMTDDDEKLSLELDGWKNQYDLACRFVEKINQCFALSLLIITGNDFATCIFDFANILQHLDLKKSLQEMMDQFNHIAHSIGSETTALHDSMDIIRNPYNEFTKPFLHVKSNPIKTCQFWHPMLRFLVILVASHMVGTKV